MRTPTPNEPLDIFGPLDPPPGYGPRAYACPRNPTRRCAGCDKNDFSIPSHCGQGDPVYRSLAWVEWAKQRFHVEQNNSKEGDNT